MTDSPSSPDLKPLRDEVARIAKESFDQDRRVVLLSWIGQTVSKNGIDFKTLLDGEGLAAFIKEHLADELEIVPMPSDPAVLAVYPKGVDLAKELDPFTRRRKQPLRPEGDWGGNRPRKALINRWVWFAFSHPLQERLDRVLRLEPVVEYEDYPSEGPAPPGYSIPRPMIIPIDALPKEERGDRIYANILEWAKENDIKLSDVTWLPRSKSNFGSVLDALLGTLSSSDMERISIPLDIVALLHSKRL